MKNEGKQIKILSQFEYSLDDNEILIKYEK